MFSMQKLFKENGHEVFPFSVKSARNVPCEYEDRFLSPVADENSAYFSEYRKDPRTLLKVLSRQLYSPEAYFKARDFAEFCKPDLVYSLQYMSKMSPAVLDGFKSAKLPVVLRVSDFSMICPQGTLFDGHEICNACVKGNFLHPIERRCIMNSRTAGIVKGGALMLHRLLKCRDRIDAYVFPSRFTMQKFIEAGFPPEKLHCIPTPVETRNITPRYSGEGPLLYFGRLSVEKGVHQLLEAYRSISKDKPKLEVVGAQATTPYAKKLMDEFREVSFFDFATKVELESHIIGASSVVIPSVWYDNLPNTLLEAHSYGKPVIAPAHGSFLDLIKDGHTGLFYQAGNVSSLREKLEWAIAHPSEMAEMGKNARALVESEFSFSGHLARLTSVFESVLKTSQPL
jgi:glycosyltransferase involved in cell wall biosynthesis